MILTKIPAETYQLILGIAGTLISVLLSVLILMLKRHITTLIKLDKSVTILTEKTFFFDKTIAETKTLANANTATIRDHEKRIHGIEIKQSNCPVYKKNNR